MISLYPMIPFLVSIMGLVFYISRLLLEIGGLKRRMVELDNRLLDLEKKILFKRLRGN